MTEKRFTTDNGSNEDVTLVDNVTGKEYESNFDEIVDLLNELHEENKKLKQVNEMLQMDFAITERNLMEENEQLKQRNTNQYNQLNELWKLIEAKDWETLITMDNQMKEDEERLQQEWKCYE